MTPRVNVAAFRQMIEAGFPDLWLPTEAALATVLAMVPEDVVNPPTCIFTGPASSGKTTVLDIVGELDGITYRSDRFTPKSFVSHSSTVKREKLPEIDLLPKLKHQTLVTPELAPLFRGREDALTETFAMLTTILDGHGYTADSGTQGRRGYTGDYLFAWLGATTPLPTPVWKIMAALGSRLFFYAMPEVLATEEALIGSLAGPSYRNRLAACRAAVEAFLPRRLAEYGGVRGLKWDAGQDPPAVMRRLAGLACLVSKLRGITSVWQGGDGDRLDYTPPNIEYPHRALACLYNLARGRALVHGRRHLLPEDLSLVAHVALSSAPYERTKLVRALVAEGGHLTTRLAAEALDASLPPARKAMKVLSVLGVAELSGEGDHSEGAVLTLAPEWRACLDPAGPDTPAGSFQPVTGEVESELPVCVSAPSPASGEVDPWTAD